MAKQPKVLVPLAPGFEEIEAITVIDILRRAEVNVIVAGLVEGAITASRGVVIQPDVMLDDVLSSSFDMIVLPGGMPGAEHLRDDGRVQGMLEGLYEQGKYIAAICAAPIALEAAGLLQGKRVTSFPGCLKAKSKDFDYVDEAVVVDGKVITSQGPGTALDFALKLVELLCGDAQRKSVELQLQRPTP